MVKTQIFASSGKNTHVAELMALHHLAERVPAAIHFHVAPCPEVANKLLVAIYSCCPDEAAGIA